MSARDAGARLRDRLWALPRAERLEVLRSLSARMRRELNHRWWLWAHPGQYWPQGDWRVWMIRAGRGFGKTRAGAEWVSQIARDNPAARIALVGATLEDAEKVMVNGPSGLLSVAFEGEVGRWRRSSGQIEFENGALALLYSAEAPEKLRGPEHVAAWCDELGKWGRGGSEAWHNLAMGLRLGEAPQTLVTTTPRATDLMRQVMATGGYVETLGRTRDNPHLPDNFVAAMMAEYGGTWRGRQELDGELIEAVEGALWTRALLDRQRVREAPKLVRVVIGVDPPAGSAREGAGDACGIVACGLGRDGMGYVLEDASVRGASPAGWAQAVAACAARHQADRIVAEKNQGGSMVETTLRAAEAGLPVKLVHASRSKSARAEPVALLYEAGKVWHVGAFAALEDELCGLLAGGGYDGPGGSPDRADAAVWALSELLLGPRSQAQVRLP